MGYNTKFSGELKFTRELTGRELAKVKTFLGEDCREHPEWGGNANCLFVNLDFLKDFSGLKWDAESGSTYYLEEIVNLIIANMQIDFPDFGLQGKLLAQGEEVEDRWWLVIEGGKAVRKDFETSVCCPNCGHQFNVIKS